MKERKKRKYTRRKYTNGSTKLMSPPKTYQKNFISSLDFRTETYHNMDFEYRQIIDDLGGEAGISAMEKTLAERLVFVSFLIRGVETELANNTNGEQVKLLEKWLKLDGAINSIIAKLGCAKRTTKGSSDLKKHLAENYNEQ